MQSDKLLISVIIPIYNQELFLEESIQSVLKQSYPFVELILVNDGSTDRSLDICIKYSSQYGNVRYIEQVNSGVSVARNRGLQESTGAYVFFLDGDDTIATEFLEEALTIALNNESDFVAIGEDYCFRSRHMMALPTCAMFLKTDFLKKHPDINFPIGIQPCEDGLLSHQLLALTDKVSLYPEGKYHYRQHDFQNHIIINQNTSKVLAQIPQWLSLLKEFYTRNNFYKSHALHLALFIEHEPFELRYIRMPFDDEQRMQLFDLIKVFMHEKVLPNLNTDEKAELSVPFLYFLESKDLKSFDTFYIEYKRKKTKKFKTQLFLLKFIPLSKFRRSLRKKFSRKFHQL